ncbi:MAG: YchF/TatD family DNA exonuclease [Verrucomicrobia bacterium]|nr:YchF/TatD family DNA exonuclease [Verrucomicrobiota bacterium]
MTLELFDSHNHLYLERFDEDREAVIERAGASGVVGMVCVSENAATGRRCLDLANAHPEIWAAVGLHPHEAKADSAAHLDETRALARESRVVAIGEIGLDYYYDHSPRDVQCDVFRRYLRLAHEVGKPIIVHCRDAFDDCRRILQEEQRGHHLGVMHCYTGTAEQAVPFLDLGLSISFAGPVTFKNARQAIEAAQAIKIERMLVETDAPFLAPQRVRGARCEPAHVLDVAQKIGEVKGLSVEDVGRITTRNARRLFGLGLAEHETIAYPIRNSLYLNVTNRCTNACIFCARARDPVVKGHNLRLEHEPGAAEIVAAVEDPKAYKEIVFCGYGEPLIRLDVVKEVAAMLRARGARRIRINTNGQANLVHGRNVLPELAAFVDEISISLNAPSEAEYARLCRSEFGTRAFEAVKEFIREATKRIPTVTATVVAVPGLDIEACRALAEELGAQFRVRPYNEVG